MQNLAEIIGWALACSLPVVLAGAIIIRLARSWSLALTVGCEGRAPAASAAPALPLIDQGTRCHTVDVKEGLASRAQVVFEGAHTYRSALVVTLGHGGQTEPVLRKGALPPSSGRFEIHAGPTSFTGSAAGAWTLCVTDTDGHADTGVLDRWSLRF